MDFSNYIDMSLIVICLAIGKSIKELSFLNKIPNKLIVAILPIISIGLKLSIDEFSLDSIACALYSSLVAVGAHQTGKQLFISNNNRNIDNKKGDEE